MVLRCYRTRLTEGINSTIVCGSSLSNTGLTVVDGKVPLRPTLLAAATVFSKTPVLGRLFPRRELVEVDEIDVVVVDAEVLRATTVRFIIGPRCVDELRRRIFILLLQNKDVLKSYSGAAR